MRTEIINKYKKLADKCLDGSIPWVQVVVVMRMMTSKFYLVVVHVTKPATGPESTSPAMGPETGTVFGESMTYATIPSMAYATIRNGKETQIEYQIHDDYAAKDKILKKLSKKHSVEKDSVKQEHSKHMELHKTVIV